MDKNRKTISKYGEEKKNIIREDRNRKHKRENRINVIWWPVGRGIFNHLFSHLFWRKLWNNSDKF